MKISFIGLGIMGSRMAKNLLKNGVELTVYNRTRAAAEPLADLGAKVADSVEDCVKNADIVFTMVSTPQVVCDLAFGPDGFLAKMKNNSLWLDCSTVNPSFSTTAAKKAKAKNIRFLDAPVGGSKGQAENAELIFYIGGDAGDLKEVTPFLDHMGQHILHVGEHGKGAAVKMLVNSMLGQSMIIFAESLLLGQKMGIDKDFLLHLLPKLPVIAPFVKFKTDNIKNDDYEAGFPLEWMHKDMHLVSKTAYELNMPLYMANLAKELFAGAKQDGMGREDFSAIFKYLEGNH